MKKTKVTIVAHDGTVNEFTGETALVFMISDVDAFLTGKAPQIKADDAFIGYDIPEVIFANLISELVSGFIQKRQEDSPVTAAFNTRRIALDLLERAEKSLNHCSKVQVEAELTKIKNALNGIRKAASQHGGGSDGRK